MTNAPPLPGERSFGYALVAASAFILWLAFGISGLSSASSAGAFPMVAAVVMLASAIGIVLRNRRGSRSERPPATGRPLQTRVEVLPRGVAIYMAILTAYVVSLDHIGFLPSTSVFLLVSLWQLHRRSAVTLLAVAIGVLLAVQVVFGTLFQVQLP